MKFVFKLLALVFASAIALQGISSVSGDCDAYSKNKAKCLLSSENNEPCSFCTSAAVGEIYLFLNHLVYKPFVSRYF